MARIKEYPINKAKELISELSNCSGTIANSDIVGITSDPEYQRKLLKQEVILVQDGLIVKNYRYDEKDLSIGSPINQDVLKISVSGGTASITALPNNPNEHWLSKLPDRVCTQLGCGSCLTHTLLVGSTSTIGCCLNTFVSGTIIEKPNIPFNGT
jgi:hypothetical protein